jgi:hypothetical protein
MKRREFITFLGGAAATWPLMARAQEPRRVIGVLSSFGFRGWFADVVMPAFFQGLKEAGFVEGKNISMCAGSISANRERCAHLKECPGTSVPGTSPT